MDNINVVMRTKGAAKRRNRVILLREQRLPPISATNPVTDPVDLFSPFRRAERRVIEGEHCKLVPKLDKPPGKIVPSEERPLTGN